MILVVGDKYRLKRDFWQFPEDTVCELIVLGDEEAFFQVDGYRESLVIEYEAIDTYMEDVIYVFNMR